MWNKIKTELEAYPERLKVARVLIENGLSAKDDKIYLNQIEIPPDHESHESQESTAEQ